MVPQTNEVLHIYVDFSLIISVQQFYKEHEDFVQVIYNGFFSPYRL